MDITSNGETQMSFT